MAVTIMRQEGAPVGMSAAGAGFEPRAAFKLAEAESAEALAFLAARPAHTAYVAGLIRDNGLTSPLNRGAFYGCRGADGRLTGVALIGHATLVEARDGAALAALAKVARQCPASHLIRVERAQLGEFWEHYAGGERGPRLVCREQLYELRHVPDPAREPVQGLRPATLADVAEVMEVNAEMAVAECGVNPLARDPFGFRVRTARRIEQGRVWVWKQAGRLIFKADVLADTPGAVYLEGVHVHASERGRGHGARCVSQLSRTLLRRAGSVCLVVNETAEAAQKVYTGVGFRFLCHYDTIYLPADGGR